jgi:general secretion pathway protein H
VKTVIGSTGRSKTAVEGGFTLLETLAVLVILGLIAAFAVPRLRLGDGQRMRAVAHALDADLRLLRVEAMRHGTVTSFMPTTTGYALEPGARRRVLPVGFSVTANVAGEALVAASLGRIAFFPDGGSTGGSILLRANGLSTRIAIRGLDGRVRFDE